MAEVQGSTTLGVANTGSARNPDGTPANPGANTPSSTPPIAQVPIETAEGLVHKKLRKLETSTMAVRNLRDHLLQ